MQRPASISNEAIGAIPPKSPRVLPVLRPWRLPLSRIVIASALLAKATVAAPGDEEHARAFFREGVALQDSGDPSGALEKYESAYALWKNPKILANIGAAFEALGRPLDAARAYDRFLDATPPGSEGRKPAEMALAEVLRKIGTLSIVTEKDLVSLTVDGVPVEDHPNRVRVLPGAHTLEARVKDGRVAKVTATVAAGISESVVLQLGTPRVTASPEHVSPSRTMGTQVEPSSSVLPWVIGGVGVAGLVASGAFYLVRQNAVSSLEDSCNGSICPGAHQSTIDRANLFGTLSLVALGVGAAGVGTAIVLLSTGSKEPATPGAEVAVRITYDGPMAVARGQF